METCSWKIVQYCSCHTTVAPKTWQRNGTGKLSRFPAEIDQRWPKSVISVIRGPPAFFRPPVHPSHANRGSSPCKPSRAQPRRWYADGKKWPKTQNGCKGKIHPGKASEASTNWQWQCDIQRVNCQWITGVTSWRLHEHVKDQDSARGTYCPNPRLILVILGLQWGLRSFLGVQLNNWLRYPASSQGQLFITNGIKARKKRLFIGKTFFPTPKVPRSISYNKLNHRSTTNEQ